MTNNHIIAIIPAAGIGQRLGAELPKQYIHIGHQTIFEYTIKKLLSLSIISQIIVALNPNDRYFSALSVSNHPKIKITQGGDTRADSVLAGLQLATDNTWALVHDAVRPCVEIDDIKKLIDVVLTHRQGGILATKITDTIKQSINQSSSSLIQIEKTHDRQFLWAAATPQMFNVKELKSSLIKAKKNQIELTDEASAIEYCGGIPLIVESSRNNIKITNKEDLPIAALYLQQQGYINSDKTDIF